MLASAPSGHAADLTVFDVTAATYNTAVETTWTFAFTPITTTLGTGNVHVVFPAGYVVGASSVCRLGGNALTTVATPNTDVVCSLGGASLLAGTPYMLTIDAVTNPVTAGTTGSFTFETRDLLNAVVDRHFTNTETIVTQALTNVDVTAASYNTGATTTWTFQFTTANAVPATGNLHLVLPSGFVAANAFSLCRLGGTALVTTVTGNTDVTCALTGGLAASTAYTATLDNVANPGFAQTTGAFTLETRTATGGVINRHASDTESIVANALTAVSGSALAQTTGAVTEWTFTFTTVNALVTDDQVRIVFPSGFATGSGAATACDFTAPASITAETVEAVSATEVLCKLATIAGGTAPGNSAITVKFTNIKDPTTEQTTGPFTIQTRTSAAQVRDEHTSLTVAITPSTLTLGSVSGASQAAGATTTWTLPITTVNAVASDGHLRVVLPAGFVATAGPTACSQGGTSVATTITGATEVRCGLTGALNAATAHTFQVTNLRNPTTAQTTGAFTIQTRNAANAVHDQHTTNTESIIASTLAGVSVSAPLQQANTVETWTVAFTTVNAVAGDGNVRIVFPAGFQTSSGAASVCDVAGVPGETTIVASATEVRCDFNGADGLAAGQAVTLTITNVRNPASAGTSGTFLLETRAASAAVHDAHAANVEGIAAAPLTGVTIVAPTQATGAVETWTVIFTAGENVAANGDLLVQFPAGFATSSGAASVCDVVGKTGETTTVTSATEVVCNLGANTVASGDSLTLTISNVKNPTTAHTTGAFVLQLRDAADLVLQAHASDTETIVASTLTDVSIAGGTQYVGRTETWTVSFRAVNPVAALGDVRVVFPGGFQTSYGAATVCDYAGKAGETTTVASTTEVVCDLGPNTIAAGESITLYLSHVRNPSYAGTSAAFIVEARSPGNAVQDHHTTNTEGVVVAGLAGAGLSAPTQAAGAVESWTLSFVTQGALESGGSLRVAFPTGFTTSSGATTSCDVAGKTGEATTVLTATEVLCHLSGIPLAAGESVSVALNHIRNPGSAQTTAAFTLELRDAGGNVRERSMSNTEAIVAHAFAAGPAVGASALDAGAPTSLTFVYTTFNAWPAAGTLRILLPAGYGLDADGAGSTALSASSAATSAALGLGTAPRVVGTTLIWVRQGGAEIPAGTPMSLTISGLRQPLASPAGAITITLTDGAGAAIDAGQTPGLLLVGGFVEAAPAPTFEATIPVENVTEAPTVAAPLPPAAPAAGHAGRVHIGVAPTAPFFAVLLTAALALHWVRRRGGFND